MNTRWHVINIQRDCHFSVTCHTYTKHQVVSNLSHSGYLIFYSGKIRDTEFYTRLTVACCGCGADSVGKGAKPGGAGSSSRLTGFFAL